MGPLKQVFRVGGHDNLAARPHVDREQLAAGRRPSVQAVSGVLTPAAAVYVHVWT